MSTPAATAAAPSRRALVVGLVISTLALAAVVRWAVQQPTPTLPDSPDALALIGLAVAMYFVNALCRGLRWHMILREARIAHDPTDAYGLIAVAHFGNTVLPARGGELARVLLMSDRSDGRRREIFGTFITERILDLALLLAMFAAVSTLVSSSSVDPRLALICVVALCLGGAAGVLYLRLRIAGRFERFAARLRPVLRSSRPLLNRRGIKLAGLSGLIWIGEAVVFWLVAEALGVSLAAHEAAFVVLLASFSGMVPSAPSYVGTVDAAVIFGLKTLGVAGGAAVGCLVMYRFVVLMPLTLVGIALVFARYGGLGALLRRRKRTVQTAVVVAEAPGPPVVSR